MPLISECTSPVAFCIAGISFQLYPASGMRLKFDPELIPFCATANANEMRVNIEWAEHLATPPWRPVFDSGGIWSLFEVDSGYEFYFSAPALGTAPYKVAWCDRTFRRSEVRLLRGCHDSASPVNALEYPLDELLAIHRLSLGEGVEVHGLGVVDEFDRGHLFIGHSGAGKSTSARLWQKHPGARVLSDDRIIVRFENGRARMYGTPWHGDAGLALAESADLNGIYVLGHGTRNKLTRIPAARAAAELLSRSFVPHHSADGLASTLQILDRITREIPCSRFEFVPDHSSVETICRV